MMWLSETSGGIKSNFNGFKNKPNDRREISPARIILSS